MSTQPTSPFKFLDSYTASDEAIFFGRDQEVEEVHAKVFQSRLLLMYGASGTGKSSIINCGLANKIDEADWLPIHIRRGGNILRSTFRKIQEEAIHPVDPSDLQNISKEDIKKAVSSVFLDHFKPVYLIFDQFEELFIFGYRDEWKAFIDAVNHLLESDLDVRFIFIIRGEYLEFLSEFEELIPDFFDNRIRIEKMTRRKAAQSISGPCEVFGIKRSEDFEEKLLNKLSSNKPQVELTFLQVYLDKIYKKALEHQSEDSLVFNDDLLEDIGEIGDVLAEFLDEQIFQMPDSKAALTVLKSFVSLEGTKAKRSLEEVVQYCKDIGNELPADQIDEILIAFVNRRILKEKDENDQFELRHDTLAQKIFEKITYQEKELLDVKQFIVFGYNEYEKRGTLLNDDDLNYVGAYERSLQLPDHLTEFIQKSKNNSNKQRKARTIKRLIIVAIVFLMITSLIGFFYSQQQKARAERLADIAEQNAEKASQQRQIAEANASEAARQAQIADMQRVVAESSTKEAEIQKANALIQKGLAEQEKRQAEQAKVAAEESEEQAIRQREIALEEKRISTRLRMLTLARELAIKTQFIEEPHLKGLLSVLAKNFNDLNGGEANQPEIYKALYYANHSLVGEDFNEMKYHDLAISDMLIADNQLWSCGHDGKIVVTDLNGGETNTIFESNDVFQAISLDEARKQIIAGTSGGAVLILDFNGQLLKRMAFGEDIVQILSMDQRSLIIGEVGSITALDEGNVSKVIKSGGNISDALILGDQLIVANGSKITSLAIGSLEENWEINLELPIKSIESGHNENVLAVGFEDGQLAIIETENYTEQIRIKAHQAAITDILFIDEGDRLVTASFDRTAAIWETKNLRSQPVILDDHDAWVYRLAFHSESQSIITAEFDGNINRYPIESKELKEQLCQNLNRQLTPEEWKTFVANDITYETVCEN